MALDLLHRERQIKAIEIQLATAPKIQEDLKAKFGYGENKFFDLDLVEYRINNSLPEIAEDFDLKERYDLINDQPRQTVSMAFRGHHDEDFFPDYQFNGLFSKETNDLIENIRYEINGRKVGQINYEAGKGIHAQTPEERSELSRIGGRAAYEAGEGIHAQTPEEKRKAGLIGGRKGNEAQGNHVWSLEEIVEIGELKYGEGLTWNDTTSKMNEKYGEDYTTKQVTMAYERNKHLITDEEE